MKQVKDVVSAVGEVIDSLTLPKREKQQAETEMLKVFLEWEKRVMRDRAALAMEETRGKWLRCLWRPLVMLVLHLIRRKSRS